MKALHGMVQDLSGREFVTHLCSLIEQDNGEHARGRMCLLGLCVMRVCGSCCVDKHA